MKKRDFFFYLFIAILLTFGITLHLTTSSILKISEKNIDNLRYDYHQNFYKLEIDIPSEKALEDLFNLQKEIFLSQGNYQRYEIMLLCIITGATLLVAYPISKYRRNKKGIRR